MSTKKTTENTRKQESATEPARFEESLAELENLVERLEEGDLSLEESLAQFERGVTLARQCRDSLSAAEQRVQLLLDNGQDGELTDLDPETKDS